MISMSGLIAVAAMALPEIRPPPPIGTTMHVEVGDVLQHFQRDGALPGDDVRVVVRVHDDEAALGLDLLAARLRLGHGLAVEHHLARRASASAATFTNGVVTGMTMVAGMPSRAA